MIVFLIFLFLYLGISFKSSYIAIGIITVLLFIFLFFKRKFKKSLLIYLSIFLFGFGISFIEISYPMDKTEYTGMVYQVKDNYFLINSKGEKLYCYQKEHDYEIGDIVKIKGQKEEFDFTVLESSFDFGEYLNSKGVHHSLKIKSIERKTSTPFKFHKLKKKFLSKFDSDASISVSSILFSDHDDNTLTNSISDLHLSRLINIGGLYFHALLGVINFLLTRKIKKKWSELITLGLASFYLILTFPRFSIIRLTFIYVFKWINTHLLNKRFKHLEILSITGIFFLLINYHLALQDSFILGFGIPILVYFVNSSFSFVKGIKKKALLIVTIYLFFIPFEMKYFNSISPLSMIYQLLLSPLFILFFFIAFISLYGLPINKVVDGYNSFLSNIVKPISKLKIEIYGSSFNIVFLFIYYTILCLLIYYSSIRFKPIKRGVSIVYLSFLTIYFLPINNLVTEEIDFINVGQGDCCLIRKRNQTIMIDTGGLQYMDLARECLIPYLKKNRIYNIDIVITTHDDFDHNGALSSLIYNFRVKKIMTNMDFQNFTFSNITFTNYNNHLFDHTDDNEKSLVIGFNVANQDFLVTGDASIAIENYIMKEYEHIPCDVLKVGHHGSKTSTSDAFVKWLKPKVGVVSVGKNNKYGHPHKEVINTLKRNGVIIRRTDIEGTIRFTSYSFVKNGQ